MTDLDNKLSCLLDDYPGDEANVALDEVIGDVNLQYRMRRYQLIGEAMRSELPPAIDVGFHSEVMAKIREAAPIRQFEPEMPSAATQSSPLLSWVSKPMAGLAIAATVAVVTVALWQPLIQQSGQVDDALVSAEQEKIELIAGTLDQGNAIPASLGMRWKVDGNAPDIQQKLNAYLVNHTEYSNSFQGLIPQARVAGFDAQ